MMEDHYNQNDTSIMSIYSEPTIDYKDSKFFYFTFIYTL